MNGEDKSKLEEALKLRESLLQSFKYQIGLRKAILELDNAIMDISIEADRNAKIIESWELHKESSTLSKQAVKVSEYTAGSITNIREELKVVEADREDLEIKRKAATRDLDASKIKTKRLRDIAAKKLNSNEQKEILTLLVKNFEFELRNIEMQVWTKNRLLRFWLGFRFIIVYLKLNGAIWENCTILIRGKKK